MATRAFMGFNCTHEMRAAFQAAAHAEDRTMAAELRRLVRRRVEEVESGSARSKPSASKDRAGEQPVHAES
jgi:hypothetical protein